MGRLARGAEMYALGWWLSIQDPRRRREGHRQHARLKKRVSSRQTGARFHPPGEAANEQNGGNEQNGRMSEKKSNAQPAETDSALRGRFLLGMSHAACTVNVVTTDGPAGSHGVTVSAMVSVSADNPQPTLQVCIHHRSAVAAAVLENRVFCVNVLRDDQAHISDNFAGRSGARGAAKFDCTEWTTQLTGAPRVLDSLVAFDC